jgi:hypothetical protein
MCTPPIFFGYGLGYIKKIKKPNLYQVDRFKCCPVGKLPSNFVSFPAHPGDG